MAQTTTNYGLLKPEATDNYNHLVYDNPNMDTIDATMKGNADHAIDSATCIKTGTVHSVTRSNTSCAVFRFTATGDWNTGDTMNVDGVPVSVFLPNGNAAVNGAYIINTEVIASIVGTRVTLMTNAADAGSIYFDNTGTTLAATDVESAIQELDVKDGTLQTQINNIPVMIIQNGTDTVVGDGSNWVQNTITFGTPFKSGTTPLVNVYQYDTASATNNTIPMIKNITNTGFTYGWYANARTFNVVWQAIGQKA